MQSTDKLIPLNRFKNIGQFHDFFNIKDSINEAINNDVSDDIDQLANYIFENNGCFTRYKNNSICQTFKDKLDNVTNSLSSLDYEIANDIASHKAQHKFGLKNLTSARVLGSGAYDLFGTDYERGTEYNNKFIFNEPMLILELQACENNEEVNELISCKNGDDYVEDVGKSDITSNDGTTTYTIPAGCENVTFRDRHIRQKNDDEMTETPGPGICDSSLEGYMSTYSIYASREQSFWALKPVEDVKESLSRIVDSLAGQYCDSSNSYAQIVTILSKSLYGLTTTCQEGIRQFVENEADSNGCAIPCSVSQAYPDGRDGDECQAEINAIVSSSLGASATDIPLKNLLLSYGITPTCDGILDYMGIDQFDAITNLNDELRDGIGAITGSIAACPGMVGKDANFKCNANVVVPSTPGTHSDAEQTGNWYSAINDFNKTLQNGPRGNNDNRFFGRFGRKCLQAYYNVLESGNSDEINTNLTAFSSSLSNSLVDIGYSTIDDYMVNSGLTDVLNGLVKDYQNNITEKINDASNECKNHKCVIDEVNVATDTDCTYTVLNVSAFSNALFTKAFTSPSNWKSVSIETGEEKNCTVPTSNETSINLDLFNKNLAKNLKNQDGWLYNQHVDNVYELCSILNDGNHIQHSKQSLHIGNNNFENNFHYNYLMNTYSWKELVTNATKTTLVEGGSCPMLCDPISMRRRLYFKLGVYNKMEEMPLN